MDPVLYAGYGKKDISPSAPMPLAGYGNSRFRMSERVTDPLFACALALRDETGSTALAVVCDMGNMYSPMPAIRTAVAEAVGLPREKVMLCATHSHSAPHTSLSDIPGLPEYCDFLRAQIVAAAREALEDLKPAQAYAGSTVTQGLNFVRRYILNDGTYGGDNYGDHSSGYRCHETDADAQLQVIKFVRQGGKDIVLTNFQGHPHRAGGSKKLECTSDLVGVYRREMEQRLGCHVAYYTGSSGNVNCHSRIKEENIHPNYIAHGKALADAACRALETLAPVEGTRVATRQVIYTGNCNHTEDYKVPQAKIVKARFESGMSGREAREGYEDLFNSPYHAISVVSKSDRPATMDVELNALCFGSAAMVFAPFELYDTLGVTIKEGSPFAATFVCCYANNIFSYMPTKAAFAIGGYGPNQCRFEPGTGEIIAQQFLNLLTDLKK